MKYSGILGGSILTHIENTVGRVLNAERPYPLHSKVKAYVADIAEYPGYRLLFTVGLFLYCEKECVICLPPQWHLPHYCFDDNFLNDKLTSAPYYPETLPLDLLGSVAAKCMRKNGKFRITEGEFLDKAKSPCSKYQWPEALQGAAFLNYNWSKAEFVPKPDEALVTLYTLVPMTESKKSLTPQWYDQQRSMSWEQLAFPLFADIAMVKEMNQAILSKDWVEIKSLISSGMNVNRGVYRFFESWGDVVSDTYLEYFMMSCEGVYADNFAMMQYLIENGAQIPPDALAQIAGYADQEQLDYFLRLGCDVNAVDKVGYSALNRAAAFDNWQLAGYIISLGGVYRVQSYDEPEKLQKLIDLGAMLDDDSKAPI